MESEDLLSELKIARNDREDQDGGGRRLLVFVGVAAVLLAVLAGAWFWWSGARAVEVETVTASAPSAGESGAVLQATGYVTARRQATVSAQIVGTLTEVLIEEGDHVKEGQVLARLEDSSQQAYLNSARASAAAAEA
ncbi:MAG: biotin/lipoyl-binding protein, partial [Rhodanobacteraceae bacterium]